MILDACYPGLEIMVTYSSFLDSVLNGQGVKMEWQSILKAEGAKVLIKNPKWPEFDSWIPNNGRRVTTLTFKLLATTHAHHGMPSLQQHNRRGNK